MNAVPFRLPSIYGLPDVHASLRLCGQLTFRNGPQVTRTLFAADIVKQQTLHHRRDDVLACSDHPATSSGPTEVTNGLLEHLRGSARGFRNLTHYNVRYLLDASAFKPLTHSLL